MSARQPPLEPALTLPFRLRDHDGLVTVRYGVNRDPAHWGFDLISLPFDLALVEGFPVVEASVAYDGPGYRATLGWIQVITVREAATGDTSASLDVAPVFWGLEYPFAAFGLAPTLFDAPGPNPPRSDETWTAESFLTLLPDIARTHNVAALLGFRWGYELRGMRPTPLPVEPCTPADWDTHLAQMRSECPSWHFAPGFAQG